MTIEQEIRQHEERVTGAVSVRYTVCCPCCRGEESFQRHDIRRRNFYYIGEDGQSVAVRSWIVRWRCGLCRMRFTDYPPFAVRGKRYVKPAIYEMAAEFFGECQTTYRSVSRRKSSLSTLWRWVSWLGGLLERGEFCLRFILSDDPNTILHRTIREIAPWKSRSTDRKQTVSLASQTLLFMEAFDELVAQKYPPSWQQQLPAT